MAAAPPFLESPHSPKHLRGPVQFLLAPRLLQAQGRPCRLPPSMVSLLLNQMARPDQEALAPLKTTKGGYRQAGKGERTILAEHTMLIITQGQQPGSGPTRITMNVNRGVKWKRTCRWSDELTRIVCFPKTAQARARQVFKSTTAPAHQIRTPSQ